MMPSIEETKKARMATIKGHLCAGMGFVVKTGSTIKIAMHYNAMLLHSGTVDKMDSKAGRLTTAAFLDWTLLDLLVPWDVLSARKWPTFYPVDFATLVGGAAAPASF